MNKILHIAWREFSSTAITKGFIIGVFVVPAIAILAIPLIAILLKGAEAPKVEGTVYFVDRSGEVGRSLVQALTPEAIAAERDYITRQMAEEVHKRAASMGLEDRMAGFDASVATALGRVPQFVAQPATEAEIEDVKAALAGEGESGPETPLAVVIVDADAVRAAEGSQGFGGFQLFLRPKMDDRIVTDLRRATRSAIRDVRFELNDADAERIRALTEIREGDTKEVTAAGERASTEELNFIIPFAFMFLLVMAVMVGGQYLLTTTVEEKSSRVVEVLLSAVSTKQLMAGKVLGQLGVGALLLAIYGGIGTAALIRFSLGYLLDPMAIVYLIIFFVLAYFMIGTLLAAVGSAVNDMREAQSLQTPVMLVVIIPYLLWMPISRDPNSLFATVLSMVPPISPFVMTMRVASTDPPPVWQIWLSIGLALVGCYVAIWFAAKVFRVGLLMYGKPPNFKTLVRWVRMA